MGMVLHCGGQEISLEDLKKIKCPKATETYQPIPHFDLVDIVKHELSNVNLFVDEEKFAIGNAKGGKVGDRFFAFLGVKNKKKADYQMMVGVRNSHSKEFPAAICCGSRVFICDNLAFSSEIVLARKHTRFIMRDLPRLVNTTVGRLPDLRNQQAQRIETYKSVQLDDPEFHDIIIHAVDSGVIAASKVPKVLQHWRDPEHREFSNHTMWSAFNAFTEVLKEYDVQDLPRRSQALHGIIDVRAGV